MKTLTPTVAGLIVCGIVGCPNASNNPATSVPIPTPVTVPSGQSSGIWNQSQVDQWLKQELKLAELTLSASGSGNYKGQGRDASGTSFQLAVTQVPGGIACEHSSGAGSTGRISFGNPVPTAGRPVPVQTPVAETSLAGVSIPETPVRGKIHGLDFTIDRAVLENGVLTLRQGRDLFPDLALDVMMFIKQGEPAEGKKLHVTPGQASPKPWLRLQWKEAGQNLTTQDIQTGYSLLLEFGRIQDGKLPGKIHAVLPDESKSSLSGTFVLEGVR